MPAVRKHKHVTMALEYAKAVVAGKLLACKWVKLACQRHLTDLAKWKEKDSPYWFDPAAAERVCDIISRFPHIKGVWARHHQKIELQPWQCFIVCVVFGWKNRATGTRRFRVAYIEVPRKNAKSTLTSALGNYLVACDNEAGAYVVVAAAAREQANLVFHDSQQMARREKGFQQKFGVEILADIVAVPASASKYEALSAEYSNLDGRNVHAALIDELHAHQQRGLWDVLETATGSREQPLLWAITTAGVNRASVCYDQRLHLIDILTDRVEDDSYFGIIYTIDEGDDPWAESSWQKSNPNYGISVLAEGLHAEAKRAKVMPSAHAAFFTKHLNVWVNQALGWIHPEAWDRCADTALTTESLEGEMCFVGVDLAFCNDIASIVAAFPPTEEREHWCVFAYNYLPEAMIQRAENTHYQNWEALGNLIPTPGEVIDQDFLVATISDLCKRHYVREICIDPFKATSLVISLQRAGLPQPVDVKQIAPNLSPAMIELEALVLTDRLRHDGDPVLAWMLSNVKLGRVGDLVKPVKESNERKIDGIVALLMCLHRSLKIDAAGGGGSAGAWVIGPEEGESAWPG